MKKLVIIGAGGHGKVIAEIAKKNGYSNIVFLDDNEKLYKCGDFPIIGSCSEFSKIDGDVIVGIGNTLLRKYMLEVIPKDRLVTLIHPNAVVADDVVIDIGSVIMAGSVINPGTRIGKGCIINTSSSVDHDCKIGDYVHIAVGSHLCGGVTIGNETWIGAGAVISNNISVCSECMIGAGAVVICNIAEKGTYVGIPAKKNS